MERIYDGGKFCHTPECCPVADYDQKEGRVTILDPQKPENGKFSMTREEWNTLLANGKPVE